MLGCIAAQNLHPLDILGYRGSLAHAVGTELAQGERLDYLLFDVLAVRHIQRVQRQIWDVRILWFSGNKTNGTVHLGLLADKGLYAG
ncbi:hypothetical protein AAHB37_16760 [Glutamicibacter halophytocola]|uniref:hypothetical protein n=1 Tax=Glutamicibacter halophytocola TaxID=1933880 RepID=UPI00321A63D5